MRRSVYQDRIRIVHLSDLHFGTIRPQLVDPLLRLTGDLHPRVVVVSGDLTQRATGSQFRAAAAFLDRIPFPQVVVPGNHDVPLRNVIRRFASPLLNYSRHLGDDVEPSYRDEHVAVMGVNTARSLTWKGGRISCLQMDRLGDRLAEVPPNVFKVVVMHHPIIRLSRGMAVPAVGRDRKARVVLERAQLDIVLSGHAHHRYACRIGRQSEKSGHSIVVVQAGTALSHRTRGMPNSFNVVELERDAVSVTPYEWLEERNEFKAVPRIRFEGRGCWERATARNED